MKIKELKLDQIEYLKKHNLVKKFEKSKTQFEKDVKHPSLNVELLEPKKFKVYSFRLDNKYRAIFIMTNGEVEILTFTNHYK